MSAVCERPHERALSRDIQMVLQDPYTSLNPRVTVFDLIAEPLTMHRLQTKASTRRLRVAELRTRTPPSRAAASGPGADDECALCINLGPDAVTIAVIQGDLAGHQKVRWASASPAESHGKEPLT